MGASTKRSRAAAEDGLADGVAADDPGVQLFSRRKKPRAVQQLDVTPAGNDCSKKALSLQAAGFSKLLTNSHAPSPGAVAAAGASRDSSRNQSLAISSRSDFSEVVPRTEVQQPSSEPAAVPSITPQRSSFKQLDVSDWLCSVCSSLGMTQPTPVQEGCIPAILDGKDVIGLAETGSGKTAAFALPILQKLVVDPYGVFALALTPTRELAFQIGEQFEAFGAGMSLKVCVVVGGMDMQQQARQLAAKPHVVVATPGRLKGLLDADSSLAPCLQRCRFLVLDEADRVLDPTFATDLAPVLRCLPAQRQTLLFSATMTQSLLRLQQTTLADAYVYQAYQGLKTAEQLKQNYVLVPAKVKEVYLYHLLTQLQEHKVRSAMLFTSTRERCRALAALLQQLGCPCAALHSGLQQRQRLAALAKFKGEQVQLLLATDVASRGLDIPTVDLVINFDVPVLAQDYVHRVGRTARAGRSGWCVTFVTQHDVGRVHSIEDLVGEKLHLFDMPENDVLKLITRVYSAKKAAALLLAEADGAKPAKPDKRMKKLLKD